MKNYTKVVCVQWQNVNSLASLNTSYIVNLFDLVKHMTYYLFRELIVMHSDSQWTMVS